MSDFSKYIKSFLDESYYIEEDDVIRLKSCGIRIRYNGIIETINLIFGTNEFIASEELYSWCMNINRKFKYSKYASNNYFDIYDMKILIEEILIDNKIISQTGELYLSGSYLDIQTFRELTVHLEIFLKFLSDKRQFNNLSAEIRQIDFLKKYFHFLV